jgi:polysaccharide deacetylase 2 family uncharacterized protein YibQ
VLSNYTALVTNLNKGPALFADVLFITVLLFAGFAATAQSLPPQVAIIIDDIGYQKVDAPLIKLPYALTFAVMPYTPQGLEMAQLAAKHGKELMLHMPMEATTHNHLLGKGALRRHMTEAEVKQALQQAIAQVPGIKGMNNHMGSYYTTLAEPMAWTMEVLAQHQLYFIDSKTSARSQGAIQAQRHQLAHRSRDIFLDNDKSDAALNRQFTALIQHAKTQGSAIAIGHPYPETYRFLKRNLPRLKREGIRLVPVSALLTLDAPVSHTPSHVATVPQAGAIHNDTSHSAASHSAASHSAASHSAALHSAALHSADARPTPAQVANVTTASEQTTPTKRKIKLSPHHTQQGGAHASTAAEASAELTAKAMVTELESVPWRIPLRRDLPGLVLPLPESVAFEHPLQRLESMINSTMMPLKTESAALALPEVVIPQQAP